MSWRTSLFSYWVCCKRWDRNEKTKRRVEIRIVGNRTINSPRTGLVRHQHTIKPTPRHQMDISSKIAGIAKRLPANAVFSSDFEFLVRAIGRYLTSTDVRPLFAP